MGQAYPPPLVDDPGVRREGTTSLVISPRSGVSSSRRSNQRRAFGGRVDDDRHRRDAAAKRPQGVAVRSVAAVVAPDAPQRRRPRGAGEPEAPHRLDVNGPPSTGRPRSSRGSASASGAPALVGLRHLREGRTRTPSRLQTRARSSVISDSRRAAQSSSRDGGCHRHGRSDRDDHRRDVLVAGEELRPLASAAEQPVDSEQDARSLDPGLPEYARRRPDARAVRRRAGRDRGRSSASTDSSPASARSDSSPRWRLREPRPLDRDQTAESAPARSRRPRVRSGSAGRSRRAPWGGPPRGSAGDRYGGRASPRTPRRLASGRALLTPDDLEHREECVGEEAAVGPVALAEVDAELEAPAHSASPSWIPAHASATPATRLSDDVGDGQSPLSVLGEPLRLQHPGAERREGAQEPGGEEPQGVLVRRQADEDPERERARPC